MHSLCEGFLRVTMKNCSSSSEKGEGRKERGGQMGGSSSSEVSEREKGALIPTEHRALRGEICNGMLCIGSIGEICIEALGALGALCWGAEHWGSSALGELCIGMLCIGEHWGALHWEHWGTLHWDALRGEHWGALHWSIGSSPNAPNADLPNAPQCRAPQC